MLVSYVSLLHPIIEATYILCFFIRISILVACFFFYRKQHQHQKIFKKYPKEYKIKCIRGTIKPTFIHMIQTELSKHISNLISLSTHVGKLNEIKTRNSWVANDNGSFFSYKLMALFRSLDLCWMNMKGHFRSYNCILLINMYWKW